MREKNVWFGRLVSFLITYTFNLIHQSNSVELVPAPKVSIIVFIAQNVLIIIQGHVYMIGSNFSSKDSLEFIFKSRASRYIHLIFYMRLYVSHYL